MKKLMVAIAATVMGISVNAATADWFIDVYDAGFTANELGGFNAYVFNGNVASALVNYLTAGTYADATEFNDALTAATKTSFTFDTVDAFGEGTTSNVGEYISVLFYADTTEGGTVYYTGGIGTDGYTYEPGNTGPGPIEVAYADFSSGTIAYKHDPGPTPPTPIPEPTSGLLMLLGIAGLALRRRRA